MAGITVPIDGDLSPILETFGKLPGRTQEEMAAIGAIIEKEAKVGKIAQGLAEIEGASAKQAKRAAHAITKQMEKAASESKAALNELKKGATVAFGGIVGDIEDVVGALGAMGPAGLAAVGALGAFAAGGAVVAGMIKLERAAKDAIDRLDEMAIPIDPAMQESIEEANASLDAFYVVMDEIIIQLAASLGPTIVEAADYVGSFAIKFSDLLAETLKTQTALEYFATFLKSSLIQAIAMPITVTADLAERLGDLGELVGLQDNALKKVGQSWDDYTWSAAQGEQAVNDFVSLNAKGQQEIGDFNGVLLDSTDRYHALADAARKAKKAKDEHASAQKAADKAEKEAQAQRKKLEEWDIKYYRDAEAGAAKWAEQQQAINRKVEEEAQQAAENRAKLASEAAQKEAEEEQRRTEEMLAAQKERTAATQDMVSSGITAAATLAQAVADSAEEGSQAQRNAAMFAFRANQAGAIASIGINTAEAVSKAIAMFGPPPSPLGIAGIATAAALGLAQAAAVAAQAPPSFHTGGMISTNPLAPDETMVRARKGEEIRTRQEQQTSAPIVVQMAYQHRVFDTFIADNMRQTSSPLRREITSRSGKLLGHRERAK